MVHFSKYLFKPIDLEIRNERLENVLDTISKKADFYFSYNSNLIQRDSLVSISVKNTTVKEILDKLLAFRFEYKEQADHVILRPAFSRLVITPENIDNHQKQYSITGYVRDEKTGQPIKDVSVYEKRLLKSTLTDADGYFRLRFRGEHKSVILTAGKENYRDTTVLFLSTLNISPQGYADTSESYGSSNRVERSGVGRFLVSSRQKIQSLNIPNFLASTPFQASLTPGLSSHGMLSSKVINKASLNVFGGYTAGVDGVEVAGLFNINRNDVKYVQVAGLTNLVGGSVEGVQVGGIMNTVLDKVNGVQVGGVMNTVSGTVSGVQIGGVLNGVKNNFSGVQIAGALNLNNSDFEGIQIAGAVNLTRHTFKGVQIGVFNYAGKAEGFRVGLVNVADSSSAYSLGLINWVNKGYHKISISTNEITNTNITFKTGNSKLYTIYSGSINFSPNEKVYAGGLGLGHDFIFSNKLSLSAEVSSKYVYLGRIEDLNLLNRFESNFQVRLFKPITLFAGPAYNVFYRKIPGTRPVEEGFKADITPKSHRQFSKTASGWLGWSAGIMLF